MPARRMERITSPAAMAIARSRAGNGAPFTKNGRVRMPARVIEPRTPAKEVTRRSRIAGSGVARAESERRFSRSRSRRFTQTQTKRSAMSAAVMSSGLRRGDVSLAEG